MTKIKKLLPAYKRKIIEELLPVGKINEAGGEKRQISSIHIWWARRPPQASRAAIFSSLATIPTSKKRKERIYEILIGLCKLEKTKDKNVLSAAKRIVKESNGGESPRVLDCFAGGGIIPLEASRLGCDSYALDINPVAHLVQLCTCSYPLKFKKHGYDWLQNKKFDYDLLRDVERWSRWLFEETRNQISDIFDSKDEKILAYIWTRIIKCPRPNCGAEIPLIRQYLLASKKDKISLKPELNYKNKAVNFSIVKNDEIDFDPKSATMKHGSVSCLFCPQTLDGKEIRKIGIDGDISEKIVAVITGGKKGKNYRPVAQTDIDRFSNVKSKLTSFLKNYPSSLPNEYINTPDNSLKTDSTKPFFVHLQPVIYGMTKFSDLFNDRQKLTLLTFFLNLKRAEEHVKSEYEDQEYAKSIITYLALLIDRQTDHLSNLCIWSNVTEQVVHVFKGKELPMNWDYAEANPFGGGSGSFESIIKTSLRSLKFCIDVDGTPTSVNLGTATSLPYENEFFDAVIIDPPYYDMIPYSDISDFFYVWLKKALCDYYPNLFNTPLTPKNLELIRNDSLMRRTRSISIEDLLRRGIKNKEFFESMMTKAFNEIYRVLKPDGILTIVFAHQTTTAWESLIFALLNSRFTIKASWPLNTEGRYRMRAQGSVALSSSIFIVCRKTQHMQEGFLDEVQKELKNKIPLKLELFWIEKIRGADFFISAIGSAIEVFGKYSSVKRFSGETVKISELLALVRKIVTDYSLKKIFDEENVENMDEQTRFYILWKWAYGSLKVHSDDARKFSQAMGLELESLIKKNKILTKEGEKVTLLGHKERSKIKEFGLPNASIKAPIIDVIHKACILWAESRKNELSDFLTNSGYKIDQLISIAQPLSNILPDGDKEKQLLQGLIAHTHKPFSSEDQSKMTWFS